jgi:hypothetical protein
VHLLLLLLRQETASERLGRRLTQWHRQKQRLLLLSWQRLPAGETAAWTFWCCGGLVWCHLLLLLLQARPLLLLQRRQL